jgi:hypothetical protein
MWTRWSGGYIGPAGAVKRLRGRREDWPVVKVGKRIEKVNKRKRRGRLVGGPSDRAMVA